MKFAVTSCSDPLEQAEQSVWGRIAQARPDHLILLGDTMYMDFGPKIASLFWDNPNNGAPANFSDVDFAAHMYLRYCAQWRILKASGIWQALPELKVHGIWDDHDFAWNKAFGAGLPNNMGRLNLQPVPLVKQQISRFLFRQFFGSLRAEEYPANELLTQERIVQLSENLSQPVFYSDLLPPGTREGLVELAPDVRLLLTDGRSFRSARKDPASSGNLLGTEQMNWLKNSIKKNGITLIASGSTLDRSAECWDHYRDYQTLRNYLDPRGDTRVLLLSGGVHTTDLRDHHGRRLIEVVASGAARPFGNWLPWWPSRGNHAMLDLQEKAIEVCLCEGEPPSWLARQRKAVIDRAAWRVQR